MTETNEPNDSAVLSVLICTVHLTICYYHVTYSFKSESTLYSCLNVKELLPRNRRSIISLSDNNRIRTHNHLVYKRILNRTNSEQWLPLHSGNYRMQIHSENPMLHDNNVQSNALYRQMLTTQLIIFSVWLNGWVFLRTKWMWVRIPLLSLKPQISHLFRAENSLIPRQL